MEEQRKEKYPKYIWDGAVGAKIEPAKNSDFLTVALTRRYKDEATGNWKYPSDYTVRNKEAFFNVAEQAFAWMVNEEASSSDEGNRQVLGRINTVKVPADQAIIG